MKKSFLSMFALAALLMTGCSSEEVTPNGGDVTNGNGEAETRYLSVNLKSSDVTRATGDYEDGSEAENEVSKVRFYFFTANGDAAAVKFDAEKSSYVNYYDWTPGEGDQTKEPNEGDNVEKELAATIVINTKSGDKVPQMIAAVLNPTGLEDESMDLSELQAEIADYAKSSLTTSGKFVMFNSVFKKGGAEFCAVPVAAENLQKSVGAAQDNPVTIYVERSVAKVGVTTDAKIGFDDENKLALKDKDGNAILVDGEQVYLKLNGWSLTAETSDGRLVKKINPSWTSSWWNKASQFRSVWAINSLSATNRYYSYEAIGTSFKDIKYTNENAAKVSKENASVSNPAANNTKVILSGTLCKEDGTPFTIVRHLGAYFGDNPENFSNLKKSILAQLRASGNNYYYDGDPVEVVENDETKTKIPRKEIDESCLQILILSQVSKEESDNNCYVYAQLTTDAATKTWYTSTDVDAVPLVNAAATINDKLKYDRNRENNVIDKALVWNSGMTYYYYEIQHQPKSETEPATMGVVRNHIYKTNITKIAGLGTPVYDPTKTIYPEKPEDNDHYIAAEINILSWRIVSDNYELKW